MFFRLSIVILSWFTLLSCSSPSSTSTANSNRVIGSHSKIMQQGLPNQQVRVLMRDDQKPNVYSQKNQYTRYQQPQSYNAPINHNYHNQPNFDFNSIVSERFNNWLNNDYNGFRRTQVNDYYKFLKANAGSVPPMEQLLRSARSWSKCGFEPYGVPPQNEWDNMVGTIRLINQLKSGGYLPPHIELVSVYRNPELNRCARGSRGSKHILNAAVDIRVNYSNPLERDQVEDALCRFWYNSGAKHNFGLGLYKSGTIHIDTQGHRTWGSTYRSSSSRCVKDEYRYINTFN